MYVYIYICMYIYIFNTFHSLGTNSLQILVVNHLTYKRDHTLCQMILEIKAD